MRWARAIGGVLLTLDGLLGLLKGASVIGGSGMPSREQCAVLGIIIALIDIWIRHGPQFS